jgi:uncharacterized Zn finger protein (UPF0148 family)
VNCTYCGTALPAGALFCGECGRAVTPEQAHADRRARADDARAEEVRADDAPLRVRSSPAASPSRPDRLVQPAAPTFDEVFDSSALDAVEKDPGGVVASSGEEPAGDSGSGSVPSSVPSLSPEASADPLASAPLLRCEHCGAELAPSDIFCPECGTVVRTITDSFASRAPSTTSIPIAGLPVATGSIPAIDPGAVTPPSDDRETAIIQPVSAGVPALPVDAGDVAEDRVEQLEPLEELAPLEDENTRGAAPRIGARFVLQFSTGETFTVHGTGLIGRNPQPEPGEYFDQLVRVLDASRSVSKTHLEFGQQDEMFWIRDRFSGNGTVFREPGASGLRCAPDKRYRLARGTRVEIGEQFFIVS